MRDDSPVRAAAPNLPVAPGLAHVATVSFLVSRIAPSAGFWIALAGGVALARVGALSGLRSGYGASLAAMLETVAVMGPPRLGIPLTQALSAPALGVLHARDTSVLGQVLVCAVIRLLQTGAFALFFILVLAGGVDAYTGTYDAVAGWLSLPQGTEAALIVTGGSLLLWAAFASTVQVLVYRRGLRLWPQRPVDGDLEEGIPHADRGRRRFDPRAVATAAAIAFVLLLASTAWALLAAVAAWLVLAWVCSRPDNTVLPAGLVIAAVLGAAVLLSAAVGGAGLDLALRRAARAFLLVSVATWLRAAAGSTGLREVFRRALRRLRPLPSVREAAVMLDELGSERQLGSAARAALDSLRPVPKRPLPVLDAVLDWVASEAARFRAPARAPGVMLSAGLGDAALVALAAAPLLVLVG